MCHSLQLKEWVGTQLPVVFSKSVTLDDLTLIFFKEKATQFLFKAHFRDYFLKKVFPLCFPFNQIISSYAKVYFAPFIASFLRAGNLILSFIHLHICSLNTWSPIWQILDKMNEFKLHLDGNRKIHISRIPPGNSNNLVPMRHYWNKYIL